MYQLIYLDHAATSIPRCEAAITAAASAVNLGNAGRGMYGSATAASKIIAKARLAIAEGGGFRIASLVGTTNRHTVCFLANTTAALNQAILGIRLFHALLPSIHWHTMPLTVLLNYYAAIKAPNPGFYPTNLQVKSMWKS